jgi:hypothetical protein
MLQSVRIRFGKIGLTIGLAGGIALFLFHRTWLPSASRESKTGTIPVSSAMGIRINPPERASVADESVPALNGSETDEELLTLARTLVARSPERAIAWARLQSDGLRERLRYAVIRAWGEKDPAAAVDWAWVQDDSERHSDMEAALAGAVAQPPVALAIVRSLMADDPDEGTAWGAALVGALSKAGQFQTALGFLNSGPPDSRADWAAATFRRWGESRPEDAIQALDSITDETLRQTAFQAVVDGWSAGNPSTLAAYALSLPPGETRDHALGQAIDNWSLQDPAGMGDWLNTLTPGTEYDAGAALMIAKTDGANRSTDVALAWVDSISNPDLKFNSLAHVLGEWAQTDLPAATEYAKNAAWLDGNQRAALLGELGTGR